MSATKTAVDQAAEKYWTDYFGDYGKQWVGKIPRRVAQAIAESLKKASASSGSASTPPTIAKARIVPLAQAQTVTGGLSFEGVFRGTTRDGAEIHRIFRAEFDANGELTDLAQLAA